MAKKIAIKPNTKVGSENRKSGAERRRIKREARKLLERGEMLGDVFIDMMKIHSPDGAYGLGSCAVALARALAALRSVAERMGVEIESLYQGHLRAYENLYQKVTEEELRNREK